MKNLTSLPRKQLEKIAADLNGELNRRLQIQKAEEELLKFIKGLQIDIEDVDWETIIRNIKTSKKSPKAKRRQRVKRQTVKPKYKGNGPTERWSGRGLPPKWVLGICEAEGITVTQFKSIDKFRVEQKVEHEKKD